MHFNSSESLGALFALTRSWVFLGSILIAMLQTVRAAEFYVAPSSQRTGNGSRGSPWDLQTALSHPAVVRPGDTIWLRGGIHRLKNRPTLFVSYLTGAPDKPITVRQFPGERAIIDGNLQQLFGGWVNYWGFEIFYSNTNRCTSELGPFPRTWWMDYDGKTIDFCVSAFDLQAPNVKAINLVIHDSVGGGFGLNKAAQNSEIYGCLSYYNGWQAPDRAHGHGFYGQNAAPFVKRIRDNMFFENLALGLQACGNGPEPVVDNFHLEGNVLFMNGVMARSHQANLLVGAFQGRGRNGWILKNFIYDTMGSMSDNNIGYGGGLANALVEENVFGTSALFSISNQGLTIISNVFAGGTIDLKTNLYPRNTYLSSNPTNNLVVVRPNQYESGRANIVVYNWEHRDVVQVDVSQIGLSSGDHYEIHNVADYFQDIICGTYTGAPLDVPMTNHSVATPVGSNFQVPASTFPEFGAFVIMKRTIQVAGNAPPIISRISGQTYLLGSAYHSIPFTIADADTELASLTLSATSSNQELIPDTNIELDGTGENRSIRLLPTGAQPGVCEITLVANDGTNSSRCSFKLTIIATNEPPVICAIADQTVNANSTTDLEFSVQDDETSAEDLSVRISSSNPELLDDSQMSLAGVGTFRQLTMSPAVGRTGTVILTVEVNDGFATATRVFSLYVNAWPKLSAIPDCTVVPGRTNSPIPFTISDAESPADSLLVAIESSAPNLLPPECISVAGTGNARSLIVNAPTESSGVAVLTLAVSDCFASRQQTVRITIDPPPEISPINDQSTVEDTPALPITFSATDRVTPPSQLSFYGYSSDQLLVPDSNITFGLERPVTSVVVAPAPELTGTSMITLKVSDGLSSAVSRFALTIAPAE